MTDEAQRQQALVAALLRGPQAAEPAALGLTEDAGRAAEGLAAYRANAAAVAERALTAAFATLRALLGADDFRQLAREHWRAEPPARGDLGEWGAALPDWIAAHPGLADWPYLADVARLDLALHRCERAADGAFDPASLALLESADPAALRLVPMPGCALVQSAWPIAAIHAAHRADADDAAFDHARAAIDARRAESVLVARSGWRAAVHPLAPADAGFFAALLADADLAAALDAAGEGFDFAAWLARALGNGWVERVAPVQPR
jgi:hypothetical protein